MRCMASRDEKMFLDELGKRVAAARKQQGLSQEALAAEAGIDRVAIGYIEQGKRRPTVTTLYKLAKGMGVKLESLFRGY